jgi:hypothetical protein
MKPHISQRGVIVAASAVAAAAASAWEYEHRRIQRADLGEGRLHVERLSDLRGERGCLETIGQGLRDEWREFAFVGFDGVDEMAAEAGKTIFVVVERGDGPAKARGIVQTVLVDAHGDPRTLAKQYASFESLASRESWKRSRQKGGDTAVLLQITTLGSVDRGVGLGSLLRNAVLNMLDKSVHYALTMTPVDGAMGESIDLDDRTTFTAAMRFHARGGAQPALLLPGYKTPSTEGAGGDHGRDVVVMRYSRDESGRWPDRPIMQLRTAGPVQERLTRTLRRLQTKPAPDPASGAAMLRRGSTWKARRPLLRSGRLLGGLKSRAPRLSRRSAPPSPAT